MNRQSLRTRAALTVSIASVSILSHACAESSPQPRPGHSVASTPDAARSAEQALWDFVCANRLKLRRTVKHTSTGVETVTESDDAARAGTLIALARSLELSLKESGRMRAWDPDFAGRFEQAGPLRCEVVVTAKGFRTSESADDVAGKTLLLEHAMSISECIRQGPRKPGQIPQQLPIGEELPAPEVAIGGVPHRFLLTQPDAGQIARLREQGVGLVVNFRHAREHADYDERHAASDAGIEYCNVPYMGVAELSDEVIDAARASLVQAAREKKTAALHCRTGNRVGPGWAAYRVLDVHVPLQQAIDEARAMQMLDPMMESATRDYIRRHLARDADQSAWKPVVIEQLDTAQQSMYKSAVEARDLMFSRLFAALTQAMSAEDGSAGVAAAIGVCKEQAPRIAQSVAAERSVMIGRTGTKLRNPANALPKWASGTNAQSAASPQAYSNADGSLGVTLPIRMAATCLACHGDPTRIDRVVAEAIASKYPKDQAVGYSEGDLRGWFWIEVPPK